MLIDRLEELLALMEAENESGEEEERGDVPALTGGPAPAVFPGQGDGEAASAADDGGAAPVRGDVERARTVAANAAEDRPELMKRLPSVEADAVRGAESGWRRDMADRRAGAVEAARRAAELEERRVSRETGEELAGAVRRDSGGGLEELYRLTVQAGRPPDPQILSVEQAGRTRFAEEPGRTAALTVDELDRAVRRDSRRYDGGMTIF